MLFEYAKSNKECVRKIWLEMTSKLFLLNNNVYKLLTSKSLEADKTTFGGLLKLKLTTLGVTKLIFYGGKFCYFWSNSKGYM